MILVWHQMSTAVCVCLCVCVCVCMCVCVCVCVMEMSPSRANCQTQRCEIYHVTKIKNQDYCLQQREADGGCRVFSCWWRINDMFHLESSEQQSLLLTRTFTYCRPGLTLSPSPAPRTETKSRNSSVDKRQGPSPLCNTGDSCYPVHKNPSRRHREGARRYKSRKTAHSRVLEGGLLLGRLTGATAALAAGGRGTQRLKAAEGGGAAAPHTAAPLPGGSVRGKRRQRAPDWPRGGSSLA